MKLKPLLLFLALFGATTFSVVAQPVWLGGPANPITNSFVYPPGWSLIANPFFHSRGEILSNAVADNTVGELFSTVPDRTVLLKFDNATHRFARRNLFRRGQWSRPNQTLTPGEGAYLFNPIRQPLRVTFTGDWLYGAISLPSGLSLISSPSPGAIDFAAPPISNGSIPPGPFASSGVPFNPQEGDIVYTFTNGRGVFVPHEFHNAAWDRLPVLDKGQSCFVLTSHPRLIQYNGTLPLLSD